MKKNIRILSLLLLFYGCKTTQVPINPIPVSKQVSISYEIVDEKLQISVKNEIKAPVRLYVSAQDTSLTAEFENLQQILLGAGLDTLITIPVTGNPNLQPDFTLNYGDPAKPVVHTPVALPLKRYKPIKILQGHNGSYSHNHDESRYAIDFAAPLRDTVYSAAGGYVIQVIQDYKYGGKNLRWRDMANKIVIYEPETGRFFLYSHLFHRGSFVKQGDFVEQGQSIGLSGNTGFSDTPHLHFNVLVPSTSAKGLISVPVDFIDGFKGGDLKKNVILQQENPDAFGG